MQEWSRDELNILGSLWGECDPDGIADALRQQCETERSERSIRVKASRLGLSAPPALSHEDEDLIVELLDERARAQATARSLSDERIAEKFEIRSSVVARIRRSMKDDE